MKSALHYLASNSTSSGGFAEAERSILRQYENGPESHPLVWLPPAPMAAKPARLLARGCGIAR
jgi:hypothetical protein